MVGDQVEAREVDQRSDGCFIDSVKLHGGLFLRRIGGANLVGDLNQLEVVFAYRLLRYRQKAEVLIRFACCSSQQVLKGLGLTSRRQLCWSLDVNYPGRCGGE